MPFADITLLPPRLTPRDLHQLLMPRLSTIEAISRTPIRPLRRGRQCHC